MAQTLIEFKKFLAKFHIEVPTGFDVQVVLDNASTDKTPAVKRRLAAHTRFVLHFAPTRSAWLNLVERWFGELTGKKLQRGTHRSVRELNTDVRARIETWNNNPGPYVWTKAADQILHPSPDTAPELPTHDTRRASSSVPALIRATGACSVPSAGPNDYR